MGFFSWFRTKKDEEHKNEENRQVSDFSNFKIVTHYIYEKSGITELDKRALTASRLQQFALSQKLYTSEEFLTHLHSDPAFYQEVLNIATVNETFFMREIKELQWLVEYIQSIKKSINILSMPSSSGEETYSILLLMLENGLDFKRLNITAYDINSQAIQKAKEGIYSEHSLHKVSQELKQKEFTLLEENSYQISQRLREQIVFKQQNIFEIQEPQGKYDVILSRNMFIYFDDSKRKEALDIIVDLLKVGAFFIKGHADIIYEHPKLQNIEYGIYKRVE